MNDAVTTLLNQPLLKGNRIAVLTVTGAGGIIASDALERNGLDLAHLSKETILSVAELSPEWMPLGNPLDLWPAVMKHGIREVYARALKAALADSHVDGVLCISVAVDTGKFGFLDVSEGLIKTASKERQKPVAVWLYGPARGEIAGRIERGERIMCYDTLEKAAWSLALLRERHRFLKGRAI
jgi:acyl-CoA synthetase (NDP forming)